MDAAWTACLDAFLSSIEDISGSAWSRKVYRSILLRFAEDYPRAFAEATRADVQAFLQQPSKSKRNYGKPVAASAKNLRLSTLTSFYKFASAYEIDGAPLFQRAMPTLGNRYLKVPLPYRAMTSDELARFFAAIPTDTTRGLHDRALFLTLFWTARRRAEIAHLRYGDIEQSTFADGHTGVLYRYRGKGKSREVKTAELPQPAYAAILAYLETSGRASTITPDDTLFVTVRGSPISPQCVYQRFHAYAVRAGLDTQRISTHSLRHTAARERHLAGQDVLDIKRLLDHSSLDVTWRYLQRLTGERDSGVALLQAKFGML